MITKESRAKMGWRKDNIYTGYYKSCEVCGGKFYTVPTSSKQHTCSRQCSSKRRNKTLKEKACASCNEKFFTKSYGKKYCNNKCKIDGLAKLKKDRFRNNGLWGEWANYREAKKFFLDARNGCQQCGWNHVVDILELHHIDRNRKNNKKENLMLLCPNCHTLEHYKMKDGQFKNNYGVKNAINN